MIENWSITKESDKKHIFLWLICHIEDWKTEDCGLDSKWCSNYGTCFRLNIFFYEFTWDAMSSNCTRVPIMYEHEILLIFSTSTVQFSSYSCILFLVLYPFWTIYFFYSLIFTKCSPLIPFFHIFNLFLPFSSQFLPFYPQICTCLPQFSLLFSTFSLVLFFPLSQGCGSGLNMDLEPDPGW